MRRDKMLYKLGLDIGNSGIKMVTKINQVYKYDNIKALATRDASDNSYVVHMDGDIKPLYFAVGSSFTVQEKTKRKFLKQIILLACANMYGEITDCDMVKIGVGLPLGEYKEENARRDYEAKLAEITQVSGYVNGRYYVFNVTLSVYAEGFSAFYYLMPELDKHYRWLIVDHGYRTTDAVSVSYDSMRNKWRVDGYRSLKQGLLEMYKDISKTYAFETGENDLEPEDVEYYLRENIALMTTNPERPEAYLNDFTHGASDVISNIYDTGLGTQFPDMSARKILLVGGGSELVYKHLDRINKQLEIDAFKRLYGNAIGFYLQLK